nr:FAD-binding domain-containing protein [Pirellula sp.]
YRCRIDIDYPAPIVEHRAAVSLAKDRIYTIRQSEAAIATAQRVYEKHGSRKRRDPIPTRCTARRNETQPRLPGMEE